MEFESFYDEIKVKNRGLGAFSVTIPLKLARFVGFKKGDKVKVMIKKAEEA